MLSRSVVSVAWTPRGAHFEAAQQSQPADFFQSPHSSVTLSIVVSTQGLKDRAPLGIDRLERPEGIDEHETIHMPAAIQPHGVLLVIDPRTESIAQVAGDTASLLGARGCVLGRAFGTVLGTPLSALCAAFGVVLRRDPTYLGAVRAPGAAGALDVTAHRVDDWILVELEPAAQPMNAALVLSRLRTITEQIGDAPTLLHAAHTAAAEVRRITGYDRAMVYQFLPDESGLVIAESKADYLSPFLNHRIPGLDVSAQARELYRRSPVRVIPDVGYVPAPLLSIGDAGPAPDMSHCTLRPVSRVYIGDLRSIGVGAAMSVSLLARGRLWGLIGCHNGAAAVVPYESREMCQHVAQILSQHIQTRSDAEELGITRGMQSAAEALLDELIAAAEPVATLLDRRPELQGLVHSSGLAISWKGAVVTSGRTPPTPDLAALVHWLRERLAGGGTLATDRLADVYPVGSRFQAAASGLLAVLLPGYDPPLLMWFRAEQIEQIEWVGNPHHPIVTQSTAGARNPRTAFATWRETVRGRSRPWRRIEMDTVSAFERRLAYVLEQKRVRELNMQLRGLNEKLAALASTDGLTGLANRRAFDERLRAEWPPGRGRAAPLALIAIDLDFFKKYNDSHGHPQGDECLRQVARVLRQETRSADLAARLGGEEFSILLPDTDLESAGRIAERIRDAIWSLQLSHPRNPPGVVTASLGFAAIIPGAGQTADELIEAADAALYRAKAAGRNRAISG
jgi:diguanylate cyclase (GGDEF)-like protein